MIYYIDKTLENDFLKVKLNDPFFCKIKALYNAYSCNNNGIDFFIQYNTNKEITAAVSKIDSTAICYINSNTNFEELSQFLIVLGISKVTCYKKYINQFNFQELQFGSIMKLASLKPHQKNIDNRFKVRMPGTKDLLDFLCENFYDNKFDKLNYEKTYVDLSHRIRHGSAECLAIFHNEKLVSSAMIISKTDNAAVLGCIATSKCYRKNGFASYLISKLLTDNCRFIDDIYLFRENGKNKNFYLNLGFKDIDEWTEFTI